MAPWGPTVLGPPDLLVQLDTDCAMHGLVFGIKN